MTILDARRLPIAAGHDADLGRTNLGASKCTPPLMTGALVRRGALLRFMDNCENGIEEKTGGSSSDLRCSRPNFFLIASKTTNMTKAIEITKFTKTPDVRCVDKALLSEAAAWLN
mmetsp:Transcript_39036/g.61846  ORF Transcript_39036/g.61846 Transcript_39036/m.61846 type:complete len:115 (-) Transcript_39036:442-786(-)